MAPLHSSLGNKSETLSQKKKKEVTFLGISFATWEGVVGCGVMRLTKVRYTVQPYQLGRE